MVPNEITLKLGEVIAWRRQQLSMTEYDFAEALDESIFYVNQLERGMIDPELPQLMNIIAALNMTMPEFGAAFEDLINIFN